MLEAQPTPKPATLPTARPKRRAVSGVLLLNKPTGCSSNDALQQVRRLYAAQKTGHTGTLDPLASGLLPLMFGEATKFASALLDADKTYTATVRLGFSSTTGDAEGLITPSPSTAWKTLSLADVQQQCQHLLGPMQQIPPMHSALKKDGKPLYAYARAGVEVERTPRTIHIHDLAVLHLAIHADHAQLVFKVRCSKGTYVRTLAEDIAKALGTHGYLTGLERTAIGTLNVGQAYTPEALMQQKTQAICEGPHNSLDPLHFAALDACLLPVDALLDAYPSLVLEPALAARFVQGQRLPWPAQAATPQRVRVYGTNSNPSLPPVFLGTGLLGPVPNPAPGSPSGLLAPDRLMQSTSIFLETL